MKINNKQPSLIVNTDTAEALIKNGYLDKKTMRLINPDIDWESVRKTMATTVRISCPDNFKAFFNIPYPIPDKVQEKELDNMKNAFGYPDPGFYKEVDNTNGVPFEEQQKSRVNATDGVPLEDWQRSCELSGNRLDKEPFVYMKPQQDTAEPNGYAKEKYHTKKLSMKDLKA